MKNHKPKHLQDPAVEEPVTEPRKQGRGRPPLYPLPERIDASPEEVAEVVLGVKPKTQWRYEEDTGRKRTRKAD